MAADDNPKVTRVKVFIDYQNAYHRARGTFGMEKEHPVHGHIRPLRLGLLLKQLGESPQYPRELVGVDVCRGEPTSKSHPLIQAQFQRQTAAWAAHEPFLHLVKRALRYNATAWDHFGKPTRWDTGEEKGIDVLLALGMALGAVNDEFDTAILMSGDTDLIPAIDATIALGKRVENAVWWSDTKGGRPLRATNRQMWVHRLREKHFQWVRDDTNWAMVGSDPADL